MKRKEGYYWVKYSLDSEWIIAYYTDEGEWVDYDPLINDDKDWAIIDERQIIHRE